MRAPQLRVQVVEYAREEATIRAIRDAVFVAEQNVPPELEHDELDPVAVHVLAYSGGEAIGTGRVLTDGRIGRMAVLAGYRGRGAGALILRELLSVAARLGLREAWCHAQCHALSFYEAHGFVAEGPVFMEAGIEHREMRARLTGP